VADEPEKSKPPRRSLPEYGYRQPPSFDDLSANKPTAPPGGGGSWAAGLRKFFDPPKSERPAERTAPSAADSEKNFLVAVTIYGGMFLTGLHLFGESPPLSQAWWYGAAYMLFGGGGAMSITPLFRERFPNVVRTMAAPKSLWAAAAATWVLLALNVGFDVYDHFVQPRPFTIGVSPIAGPAVAPAPPEPNVPRVYTKKTVQELGGLCTNRTALQCDEFMADEKGRWITVEGQVESIWGKGEDTGVTFTTVGGDFARLITCDFGKKWRDRLNALRPHEPIQITGKIGPTQVNNWLMLQECELSP